MSNTITTAQLCEKYGVTDRLVRQWVASGCPVWRRGKGSKSSLFQPERVAKWVDQQGKRPKGVEGAAMRGQEPETAMPADGKNDSADLIRQLGMAGYVERCRKQERFLYGRFVQLTNSNAPGGEIAAVSRALTAKGEELRRGEMALLEHQKLSGELVNKMEMRMLFVELASSVRERIMSLPNELAPVLRDYLRDQDDVGKVRDELDAAVRHALASLPDKLPTERIK